MSDWVGALSEDQQHHSILPEVAPAVMHTINSIAVEAHNIVPPITIQALHYVPMLQYRVLIPIQQNMFESVHLQNSVSLQPYGMSNLLFAENYPTNDINTIQNYEPLNQVQINTSVDEHIIEPTNDINTIQNYEPLNQVQIITSVDKHIIEPTNDITGNTIQNDEPEPVNQVQINTCVEHIIEPTNDVNTIQNYDPLNQVQINTCVDEHIIEPTNDINTIQSYEPLNQVQINTYVDQHIIEPLNQVQINTCDQHITNQYSENINTAEDYEPINLQVNTHIPQYNQNQNSIYMNTIENYELLNQFQVNTCIAQDMENQNSDNINIVNNDEAVALSDAQVRTCSPITEHIENDSSENVNYHLPDSMPTVMTVQSIDEQLQEMSSINSESENIKLDEQIISLPLLIINTLEQDCLRTADNDGTSEGVVAPEKYITTVSQSRNIVLLAEAQEEQNISDNEITDTVIGSKHFSNVVNTSEVESREEEFASTSISDNFNICRKEIVPTSGVLKSVQSIDSVLPAKEVKVENNLKVMEEESELSRACLLCGKYFKNSSTLKLHLVCRHAQSPFKCDMCPRSFKLQGSLDFHKLKHSNKKNYLCKYCTYFTSIKAKFLKHEKQQHLDECAFQCKTCDNVFKKKDFPNHILTHTNNTKLIQCEKCDKSYKEYSSFYSHMKTHNLSYVKKAWELCIICDKTVKNLERHRKEHTTVTERKVYKCDTCNKCIATRCGIIIHLRMHTGGKPYLYR